MKYKFKTVGVAMAVAACAGSAKAVPTLYISDGANSITLSSAGFTQTGAGVTTLFSSAVANSGIVTWNGSMGVWTVTVTTGLTKPVDGTATIPNMHLNSIDASRGAGDLTIMWSDTDFGPTPPTGNAFATIGGTINNVSGSTLTYSTFGDPSPGNALATTVGLTSQSFGAGSFSGNQSGPSLGALASPYSLTQVLTLHHSAAGSSSMDAKLTVPDGGSTVALLGFALMGVEGVRRKFGK